MNRYELSPTYKAVVFDKKVTGRYRFPESKAANLLETTIYIIKNLRRNRTMKPEKEKEMSEANYPLDHALAAGFIMQSLYGESKKADKSNKFIIAWFKKEHNLRITNDTLKKIYDKSGIAPFIEQKERGSYNTRDKRIKTLEDDIINMQMKTEALDLQLKWLAAHLKVEIPSPYELDKS